jgi:hypothetical protein
MTATMRAVDVGAESSARIPRVAVVQKGRIIDEILVRDGSPVTIGTSEEALLVVAGTASLPPCFELIERVGERWFLRFTDAMSGTVAGPNGLTTLAAAVAAGHAHPVQGARAHRLALAEDGRGKVVLGDTTFLFQIVARPPIAPQPRLPLSVKSGLGLDWNLTILVAFSFLLHFGIAGAIYSDWLDPVITTDHTVAGLIDDLARLPKPAPEPVPTSEPTTDAEPAPAPVATNTTKSTPGRSDDGARSPRRSAPRMSDDEAAALADRADRLTLDLLAARRAGPAVQRALDRSAVPNVDLSAAAEKNIGASHDAASDLKVASGRSTMQTSTGLPGVAGDTRRVAKDKAGTEDALGGPTLRVDTTPSAVAPGTVSDADRVIASLRSRFRKCYQAGLSDNPTMSGKAVIVAKVGPNGEVASAEVGSNDGLSPAVTGCLVRVVSAAQFTNAGATTTLRIPVSLVQQR